MKRVLKWLGYAVGGLAVVLGLAVGAAYATTSRRLSKTYPTQVETVNLAAQPGTLERGRHLAVAVGKCTECHGENLGGEEMSNNFMFARLEATNLTSGRGGIAREYTDADWVRAIRYGVGRNGRPLVLMPSEAFYHFTDADLAALVNYLKSVPPVDNEKTPTHVGPIARVVAMFSPAFPLAPAELVPRNTPRMTAQASVSREYGEYLAKTGGCTGCHGSNLAGGADIGGVTAANLTPAALASWTETDFMRALRTGRRPDGRQLDSVMPWPATKHLTDDEIRAMWLYVKSVPPVRSED